METHFIDYQVGNTTCKGFLAFDPTISEPKPAILVAHAWRGQDEFARNKAIVAKLGYIGFALDIYGDGLNATDDTEGLLNS